MSDVVMLWEAQELQQRRKILTQEIKTLPIITKYRDELALYQRMLTAQQGLRDRVSGAPGDNALKEQYDDLQGRLARQRQTVMLLQQEGKSQYDALAGDLKTIPERIDKIKQKIRPDLWRKFERLLAVKQGRAVALVRKRHCLGCGISLSEATLSRLRSGITSVVECEHCSRLLIWE